MCAENINKNVIDHTALIRGSAAQNNIDLDRYREEVRRELEEKKDDKASPDKGITYDSRFYITNYGDI